MVIFHSYVKLPEGTSNMKVCPKMGDSKEGKLSGKHHNHTIDHQNLTGILLILRQTMINPRIGHGSIIELPF